MQKESFLNNNNNKKSRKLIYLRVVFFTAGLLSAFDKILISRLKFCAYNILGNISKII